MKRIFVVFLVSCLAVFYFSVYVALGIMSCCLLLLCMTCMVS